ncbi:MAG: ABC transporter ATP-binding protein/permease [Ilumatobacteraceae bacterium]|nr:ABC transporter ATP-binding protein/permease [Ilumatobacteraceae bacterium]
MEHSGSGDKWRLLLAQLREQRRGLAAGVAVGLAWTLGKIAIPQLTRLAIDQGIVEDGAVWAWAGLIALAGVVIGVFAGARRYLAFSQSRLTEMVVRERLFSHVLSLHIGYHDRSQTGQLMSRASSDLNQLQAFVVMIPLTISNVALIGGVVVVLFVMDPLLALVALAPLPFVNITARRFSQTIHPAVMAVQAEQAQLATVVEETVGGIRVVKGFGAEPVQAAKLRAEADDIQRVSMDAARVRARYLPAIDLLPSLGLIAVLGVGGHRVLNGEMSVGELVAFNTYVALLVWPLRTIGMTIAFAQRAAVAMERVHEVLGTVPEIVDPPHPRSLPTDGRLGAVRFEHVRFGYGAGIGVLDDFDLDVPPGSSVALVGATGSGKSTVARLLLRFYDVDAGAVTLDGVDVRDLPVTELRRAVGVVFEDTLLFLDTVAANIAFAYPDADAAVIERAARLAGAHEFIEAMPDGYDTVIGERGFSLSGGQRQRIAIARAIVADPRVLVLDDATSAVDPSKEHEIRAAMETVMQGRTTIVIAHRAGTIAIADQVALLDEGRVAAVGTHHELLASNERYREVLAAMSVAEGTGDREAVG